MHDLSQVLKAGTLLIVETGEYSDSSWQGPVRMLKDATKGELADGYRSTWKPEDEWDKGPDPYDFLGWLIKEGWAEDINDVHSWHVGSYGRFEP